MKNKKRLIARIGAVIAVVLLVGALAVPCFADVEPNVTDHGIIKNAFFNFYDLESDDPLRLLLNSNRPAEFGLDVSYCFQFSGIPYGEYIVAPELLTLDFNNDTQLSFVAVKNLLTGVTSEFGVGYWTTNYTSNGDNRIIFFKFNEYLEGESRVALQLRVEFDFGTKLVTGSTISSTIYPIDGDYDDFVIASITNVLGSTPLLYAYSCGFADFDVSADYISFVNGYNSAYEGTYSEGYNDGYDVGYDAGYDEGYIDGDEHGFNVGASTGYNQGFTDGKEEGYQEGLQSTSAWQEGYDKAVEHIDSGEFGRNFIGASLNAPIDALRQFTIVEWTTEGGTQIQISLVTILSAVIGVSLFIWFLKMFAGG